MFPPAVRARVALFTKVLLVLVLNQPEEMKCSPWVIKKDDRFWRRGPSLGN